MRTQYQIERCWALICIGQKQNEKHTLKALNSAKNATVSFIATEFKLHRTKATNAFRWIEEKNTRTHKCCLRVKWTRKSSIISKRSFAMTNVRNRRSPFALPLLCTYNTTFDVNCTKRMTSFWDWMCLCVWVLLHCRSQLIWLSNLTILLICLHRVSSEIWNYLCVCVTQTALMFRWTKRKQRWVFEWKIVVLSPNNGENHNVFFVQIERVISKYDTNFFLKLKERLMKNKVVVETTESIEIICSFCLPSLGDSFIRPKQSDFNIPKWVIRYWIYIHLEDRERELANQTFCKNICWENTILTMPRVYKPH